MPNLENTILFLEEDSEAQAHKFDRDLQTLLLNPEFRKVKSLVFGRFQKDSKISPEILRSIISSKRELAGVPVIANCDFGHTSPIITFPIGGEVTISAGADITKIVITRH